MTQHCRMTRRLRRRPLPRSPSPVGYIGSARGTWNTRGVGACLSAGAGWKGEGERERSCQPSAGWAGWGGWGGRAGTLAGRGRVGMGKGGGMGHVGGRIQPRQGHEHHARCTPVTYFGVDGGSLAVLGPGRTPRRPADPASARGRRGAGPRWLPSPAPTQRTLPALRSRRAGSPPGRCRWLRAVQHSAWRRDPGRHAIELPVPKLDCQHQIRTQISTVSHSTAYYGACRVSVNGTAREGTRNGMPNLSRSQKRSQKRRFCNATAARKRKEIMETATGQPRRLCFWLQRAIDAAVPAVRACASYARSDISARSTRPKKAAP